MKKSSRQALKDKIAKEVQQVANKQNTKIETTEKTGIEEFKSLLSDDAENIPNIIEVNNPKIVLYLRENLKGAVNNWTKYPNDIHKVINQYLDNLSEGTLYMYLWWRSWGFSRNYCRVSQAQVVRDTLITSERTVRRSINSLSEKHFVVKGLLENDEIDISRDGTLYRILTPSEIIKGVTEENVQLKDIPVEGVCMKMADTMSPEIKSGDTMSSGHSVPGNKVSGNEVGGHNNHTVPDLKSGEIKSPL